MQLKNKIIVFVLLSSLFACVKQKPQLPANKNMAIDSTQYSLQIANEKLIAHEDSILNVFVNNDTVQYNKDKNGYWFRIQSNSNTRTAWDLAKIEYSCFSLNNQFYCKKVETIKFGKTQLIPTLDELVKKMSLGDSATAIAPWYLAYGLKGKNKIPPYTSIKITLKLMPTP